MKKISIAGAVLLFFGAAQAQQVNPPIYGEIGYSFVEISVEGEELKPGVLRGLLGYEAHPNVDLETMLGFGVKADRFNVEGFSLKADVEHVYGFYIKPKFKASKEIELYGRLGYATTKLKISSRFGSESDSEGDFSYGAGLSYSFSPNVFASGDYVSYYNKDGAKVDGFTLGVGFKF